MKLVYIILEKCHTTKIPERERESSGAHAFYGIKIYVNEKKMEDIIRP